MASTYRLARCSRSAGQPGSSNGKCVDGPNAGIARKTPHCPKCARVPPDPKPASIVHGDFKLDNLMLDANDAGKIVAVFDWEMSALGDPLVDLGILLAYWSPTAPPEQRDALTSVTDRPGYLTRDEIIERYAARSNRDVSGIRFYEVFAVFKIAVVIQQIFYRYVRGQTRDARFAAFDKRVEFLARCAASLVTT